MSNDCNIRRIQASILVSNSASVKMHEKCGYKVEGILQEAVYMNGKYQDQAVPALVRGYQYSRIKDASK